QKIVLPEIPIKKTLIIAGLSLLALLLLLSAMTLFFSWRSSSMRRQIELLNGDLQETRRIKTQTKVALDKLKDIRALTDKKFYWASLLNAVSDSVTRGVWLTSLSLGEVVEETPRRSSGTAKAGSEKRSDKKQDKKTEKAAVSEGSMKVLRLEGSVLAS